jgi:hypothetical protein
MEEIEFLEQSFLEIDRAFSLLSIMEYEALEVIKEVA